MNLDPLPLAVLVVAGVAAGFINAVAGAGSLLTLPALIFTGLDPSSANATNRVAVAAQTVVAAWAFRRSGVGGGKRSLILGLIASPFAALGAWTSTLLSEATLRVVIAVAMAVFLVLSLIPKGPPDSGAEEALPDLSVRLVLSFAAIGFYAGFLQAGVGVLILLYLSFGHHVDLAKANLPKVLVVLVFTVVALGAFIAAGTPIDLARGAVLTVGTSVGAWLGARSALRGGAGFVRVVLVVTVAASAAKLVWDTLGAR